MSKNQVAFEAKQLCRSQHSGVLSSQSVAMPGYPFGSIVPFVLTHSGEVIIYISDIAVHTRNINACSKVSLTVFDASAEDSQANARLTIMGDAIRDDTQVNAQVYFALFPQAKAYQQTHDFRFYKIAVARLRYIGGFGKIHWLTPDDWHRDATGWHEQSAAIIDHMNQDHQQAMQLIVRHVGGVNCEQVKMISVFTEGVHYTTPQGDILFIPFDEPCDDATAIRQALVAQTHRSREALGEPK